ncbi:MAG TPA: histidine phosphatase family protein [Polyangiaceae bacterium]|nr:histidine phosphatase family protein [Polyangiaceae bacterium]
MLTLHFVRHGDTAQATEGILCGDLDPPLTDHGHEQAERVGRAIAALAPRALFCSPKVRARMTAEPAARACGLQPIIEDGLREIAYGAWEGRVETEVAQTDAALFDPWRQDPSLASPPGGETAFAVASRALPVVHRVREAHGEGHVVLVSHKATVRVLVCALLGMPLGRFRSHVACPTASITSFEFGDRGPMLVRLGDVHHLAVRPM